MAAALALLSAIVYGTGDFYGGLTARRLPAAAVVLRSNAIGLLGLLVVAPLIAADDVGTRDLALGAAGGLVGGIGVLLLYRGLAAGTMSIVAPITAVLAAAVPVVVGLIEGERPGVVALIGIPLALLAISLLAREPGTGDESAPLSTVVLLTALLAGLGFGLFFVCLDAASDDAGMWPLVAGRAASVAMFSLVALTVSSARVGDGRAHQGSTAVLLVVCGVCDTTANSLFLLATHHGLLTVVAVLGSLYPASTVLLATTVTHERLVRHQVIGVALALVAVVLITAG